MKCVKTKNCSPYFDKGTGRSCLFRGQGTDPGRNEISREMLAFQKLNKLKFLRTVTLEVDPWILRTLPNPVYGYSSNDCAFIESSTFPDQDARRVYGATCSPSLCAAEQTLRLSAFSAFDCCTTPSTETRMVVAYVNVMRNAYVNRFGDAHVNNVKLIPVRCEPEFKVEANYIFYPNYLSKVPVYHEVLSVATFWGDGYYHAMVEEMARLAPYVPFLRANQGIKVHVQSRMSFVLEILELLGIGSDRVIDGPIRARSLYVPNGLRCDAPNAFNVLLLRHLLLKYTGRDRDLSTSKNHPPRHLKTNASKYLILIKRTKKRKFNHHEKIRDALRRVATRRSHGVEVFSDEALPPLVEAARLFRDASLVVAPHGAGLTNMLFSTPGTTVVEALCFNASAVRRLGYHGNHVSFPGNAHTDILNKLRSPANQRSYVTKVVSPSDNILRSSSNQLGSLGNKLSSLDNSSPDDRYAWIVAVNMQLCYRNLAHILGLRYYGLVYPDRHCNDTTAADLAGVVSALLSQPHIDLV